MNNCDWISTQDALPEDFQDVLTVDSHRAFRVLWMAGERWRNEYDDSFAPTYITHWTELPICPDQEDNSQHSEVFNEIKEDLQEAIEATARKED